MSRLVKHIEQLLYSEECVVVLGLGAFIRHSQPAHIDATKGLVYPGKSTLSFNALLCQNDGLMVSSYSRAYSFGYKRASSLLEKDVLEMKQHLQSRGVVQVGSLGKLTLDRQEGGIAFIPNQDHPFSIDYYGLVPVATLPTVGAQVGTVDRSQERNRHVVYLPVNLQYVKVGAISAAVVGALALLPWQNMLDSSSEPRSYEAGFLNQGVSSSTTPLSAEPTQSTSAVAPETVERVAPEVTAQKLAGLTLHEVALGEEAYYLVVATLKSEQQVALFMSEHPEFISFTGAGVLRSSGGQYRIFAERFSTREEALMGLEQLVKNQEYKDTWVYKSN